MSYITGRGCQVWRPRTPPENYVHVNPDGSVLTRSQEEWDVTVLGYHSIKDFDEDRWNHMSSFSVRPQPPVNCDFDGWSY